MLDINNCQDTGWMLNYTCKDKIYDKNSLDISDKEYQDKTFVINKKYSVEEQDIDSNGRAILKSDDDLLTLQKEQAKKDIKNQYNPIDVALNQNGEQDELTQSLSDIDGATDNDSLIAVKTNSLSIMQNRLAGKSSISTSKKV
jgi:hypothetical protein